MNVATKNIDLKITHEELDYGMGFLMDHGLNNDYHSNVVSKGRFANKGFVGIKQGDGAYYFEDKKTNQGISNSKFFGYKLLCIENQSVFLTLIIKKGSLWFGLLFLIIPAAFFKAGFVTAHYDKGGSQIIWWGIALMFYLLCGYLFAHWYFNDAGKKIKKDIETRLKIREYHRQKKQ